MYEQQYSGERRIPGTDLRTRLNSSTAGTWGEVIRAEQVQAGREGDTWNPPRMLTMDRVVATTERFPAFHTDGAIVAVRELGARVAGHQHASFGSWGEVVAHAKAGKALCYHAPLDTSPRSVVVRRVYKNGKLRLDACSRDCDPFTADEGHLDRMRYRLA